MLKFVLSPFAIDQECNSALCKVEALQGAAAELTQPHGRHHRALALPGRPVKGCGCIAARGGLRDKF
jgi:hypothetical protein